MTINETTIKAFAAQFDPPMAVCRTARINNHPVKDAWQCTFWSDDQSLGFTALAYNGQFHAYLESAGGAVLAEDAGKAFRIAMREIGVQRAQDGKTQG